MATAASSSTGALMELLKKHEELSAERLRAVRDRVVRALGGVEELSVACRLFATGVEFLESEDIKVLLSLPREERRSLQEILEVAD